MLNEEKIQSYMQSLTIEGMTSIVKDVRFFDETEPEILKADDEVKIVKTACRACIANCGVLAYVKHGRVVKLEGNPVDPMSRGRMCAKGLSGIQALYNPNRNKYPLERVGERGSGKWRRITWDEALTKIGTHLMETKEKYGAEAVFCSTGGGGNPEIWSIARFCNIFGTPNWFEPGCAQCYLPRVLSYTMMYGGVDPSIADSNALELYFDTEIKCLVLWGTDPSYSCPSSGGRAVNELRAKGVKTIVVDPRFTPDAAKADVWLPIRPGTDVALQLSWIRYIMENKLYDEEFVMKWSDLPYLVDTETKMMLRPKKGNGPDEPDTYMVWDRKTNSMQPLEYPWNDALDPVLDGEFEVDGKVYKTGYRLLWERVEEWTLEKAAEVCWLDAAKIEEAILLYTKTLPSGLCIGVATDQTPNSVQAAMSACIIDCLVGNVERPGALLQRFRTSGTLRMPNYPVPQATKMLPKEQLLKRLGGIEHKGLHIWWAGHPTSILDAVLTGEPYKPHMWIDRSGNKFGVVADAQKVERVVHELDYIVHVYMYPTSFSAYADILIPAAEWLETDMLVETCNMLVARQAATHLWEACDETLFWSRLAKKCAELGHENCKKAFDPEFMGEDLAYWDTMDEFFDQCTGKIGMTWQEVKDKAPFEYLSVDDWRTYYVYKQLDEKTGKPQGFPTPSKKIEMYLDSMITLSRTGQPYAAYELPPASKDYDPLPYYLEPIEGPYNDPELAKEFPLVMTNGRVPFYHHSTLRNVAALREMYPVPELWMHPTDAAKYGVAPGDWVWIESLRGKIRAKAYVTEGMRPGAVCMERFWTPETLNTKTHGWKEMNVNVLTKASAPFNDVVGTYTLRAFQVKVYKAEEGAPEGVWTKPEDFKTWLPIGNA
ncbi:MAG: molybdopterin-dependent oxidoreductase [Clostridiales bacterium]|nr:molybdopterin-dependent oxidoreductase [Clostridiales bacterium]MDY3746983.1 molybdopterin-dependent oxidoreductase [Lachnospiraceae bacterium]